MPPVAPLMQRFESSIYNVQKLVVYAGRGVPHIDTYMYTRSDPVRVRQGLSQRCESTVLMYATVTVKRETW